MQELQDEIISKELKNYIVQSCSRAIADNVIRKKLLEDGWAEELISEALSKK